MTGEIKGSGSISFRMGLSLSFQAGSGSDSVRTVPVAVLLRRGTWHAAARPDVPRFRRNAVVQHQIALSVNQNARRLHGVKGGRNNC